MLASDIVTQVQRTLDDATSDTKLAIWRWINDSIADLHTRIQPLEILQKDRSIRILPQLTGTATAGVTAGSRNVTLPASTLTIDYCFASARFGGQNATYRLADVLGQTSALLDRPWEFATDAAVNFQIMQDTYFLGSDVEHVDSMTRMFQPIALSTWTASEADLYAPNPILQGSSGPAYRALLFNRMSFPLFISNIGTNSFANCTDGGATVTITDAATAPFIVLTNNALYGVTAGGASQQGADRLYNTYLRLNREDRTYRIRTIQRNAGNDGDTITLEEAYRTPEGAAAPTQQAFSIGHFQSPLVRLWPLPNVQDQVQFKFKSSVIQVSDDTEVLPFPSQYHYLILMATLSFAYVHIGKLEEANRKRFEYDRAVRQMISTAKPDQQRHWCFQPWNATPQLSEPRWPGNFENRPTL